MGTSIDDWSLPRLAAELELDGLGQRVAEIDELPAHAIQGCICTNGHEPDSDGLIFTSPACSQHGLKYPDMTAGRAGVRKVGRPYGHNQVRRASL